VKASSLSQNSLQWRVLALAELNLRTTRLYPKVSGLAAWSENCKWYSSLPLGAVYRYSVNQSSEFCLHNALKGTATSKTNGKCVFLYRLSPETFRYTLVYYHRLTVSFIYLMLLSISCIISKIPEVTGADYRTM